MSNFAPSILAADFSKLKEEIEQVTAATYLHLDVMDGRFVPNITFGPMLIKDLRPYSKALFDTHLMIIEPERYIEEFAAAGSDIITVHVEAVTHLDRVVNQIKENGCQAGLALTPTTPLSVLDHILTELDLVLLMTVNPGYGGQRFIPYMIDKIVDLRRLIDQRGLAVKLQIDGGVNSSNVKELAQAGVDIFVAGSAIFGAPDPGQQLKKMEEQLSGVNLQKS